VHLLVVDTKHRRKDNKKEKLDIIVFVTYYTFKVKTKKMRTKNIERKM
jgi:hypothetical protein